MSAFLVVASVTRHNDDRQTEAAVPNETHFGTVTTPIQSAGRFTRSTPIPNAPPQWRPTCAVRCSVHLRLNALMAAYSPDRPVVQLDTEWGLHCGGPNGERADNVDRNASIFGTIHRAVRLIYYAREGMLAGVSSWQMLNRVGGQGFGVLAAEAPE